MTYQLGQYVRQHNRRHALQAAAGGALMALGSANKIYKSLPQFSGSFGASVPKAQAAIIRASHEPKQADVAISHFPVSSASGTFDIVYINPVVQGNTAFTRTGRDILVESVEVRGYAVTTAVTNVDLLRVVILWDNESRGAAPAYTDVYSTNLGIMSLYNLDNSHRFKILYDSGPLLVNSTAATNGMRAITIPPIKIGRKVRYYNGGNAGTVADVDSGGMFLLTMSDTGAADFGANVRTMFRDV
jgi:hypothetical protein